MRSCGPVCEISRTTSETSIIESPFSTPSLKSSKNKSFMRPPVRIQSHITITEHGFQGSKKIMPEESKLWSGAHRFIQSEAGPGSNPTKRLYQRSLPIDHRSRLARYSWN